MLIMAEKHTAKKGKFYNSKYQDKWATPYQICPVNINSFALYVIPCKKNISFWHMELADVKQHCNWKTHRKMANAVKD